MSTIFNLPRLPYKMDGLEPYISKKTLGFHYGKHHQDYLTNLNGLISGTRYENTDLETIIKVTDGPVLDNAAQAWNHTFYFNGLKPFKESVLKAPLTEVMDKSFGFVSFFKELFVKSAVSLFGSGWVWLVRNPQNLLEITQENNAGNPLRRVLIPLLGCDVWEHAYYLDYQNRRLDYVEAFWNLINWELVGKRYNDANKISHN